MRLLAAAALVLAFPALSAAVPGDPRALRGTLEWPSVLSAAERFVVVRGDDGAAYAVDISTAQRRDADNLRSGSRLSLLGVEGNRPWEVAAVAIGAGDQALAGVTPAPPAAPAPGAMAPAASPRTTTDALERRVDGRVQSLTGTTLVVEAPGGRAVSVDASALSEPIRNDIRPGDRVTVFVTERPDGSLAAAGFIQSREAPVGR
jgi:hypothetical protein